jgi:hypothetical protein
MQTSGQWQRVFDTAVFPLLKNLQGARSGAAASAPELKKGVKMQIHHSRDTAHKQVRRGLMPPCLPP